MVGSLEGGDGEDGGVRAIDGAADDEREVGASHGGGGEELGLVRGRIGSVVGVFVVGAVVVVEVVVGVFFIVVVGVVLVVLRRPPGIDLGVALPLPPFASPVCDQPNKN